MLALASAGVSLKLASLRIGCDSWSRQVLGFCQCLLLLPLLLLLLQLRLLLVMRRKQHDGVVAGWLSLILLLRLQLRRS